MSPDQITRQFNIDEEQISKSLKSFKNFSEFKTALESLLDKETTELLANILIGAIHFRSSDIHIESQKDNALLRFRVDGMLQDVIVFENIIYKKITSRLKLLSRVKLNITDRAQDGSFSINFGERLIEIRASFLPAEHGEDIVLRILDPLNLLEMSQLGLDDYLEKFFKKEISRPNGMILVTGPTGSGKTTTLYAFLKELQKPELKIITIEDPIEYRLKGISQTQVMPGRDYTFAKGLRAIVRQDPDVILVGEIRDLETVEIALQAALTGHLVFSTLHTNDAAGAITRLMDLGAKSASISPAINMIIAQRLVRKICQKCAKWQSIPSELLAERDKLQQLILSKQSLSSLNIDLNQTKILVSQRCEDCNFTGYKGRIGIYEAFVIDDELESFILSSPSIFDLRNLIEQKGMITMYQNGLIKIFQNLTTLEEVKRVAGK